MCELSKLKSKITKKAYSAKRNLEENEIMLEFKYDTRNRAIIIQMINKFKCCFTRYKNPFSIVKKISSVIINIGFYSIVGL